MDPVNEQDYSLASGQNKEVPKPKFGSKEGSTRECGRGGPEEATGDGGGLSYGKGYTFFGDPSGKNEDTYHEPEVKQPTKPTLMPPNS